MSTRQTWDARADEIDRLFEEHRRADFPDRLREERAGVEVTLLDADLSGLVRTWLHGGRVGPVERAIVSACLQDLDRLLPRLTDVHERRYVGRLRARRTARGGRRLTVSRERAPAPAAGRRPRRR